MRWCRLAWWLCLAVGVSQLRRGQLLRAPGNRCTQAVLTELMWRLLIVATVAVTVDDVVGRRAVALAGNFRGAIRQQLDIAVKDKGHRLVHPAVALGQ